MADGARSDDEARLVPDGSLELVMAAEGLVMADKLETLLTLGAKIGVDGDARPVFVITAAGRINRSDERTTVNIAVTPKGALDFAMSVFTTLEAGYGLVGVPQKVDPLA